jgi:putative MATE family efflux protein
LPGRLAGLSVPRQVAVLAIWPFCEQLLGFAVGFVDTAIAGRLSVEATEAIAVGAYLGWLINLMFAAVGIGAGSLVARAVGGRHRRIVNAAVGQGLIVTAVVGSAMLLSVWLLAPLLSQIMNLVGESRAMSIVYVRTLSFSIPALGILFVSAACLRSSGDTRTPFYILALVNVINVFFSYLFVFGPAPWGGHGVRGIALGTVVAWLVGATTAVIVLTRGRGAVRLFSHRLRPEPKMMRRILRISGPQFLDSLAMWSGNFLLAAVVGYLGRTVQTGALAAHIVVIRIEAISYLPGWALALAAATLMGQYLGLGDAQRARQAVCWCWGIAAIVMTCMGLVFLAFAEPLVRLISAEPRLLELAAPLLRICGPAQIFLGTAMVLEQAVRGAGDTRPVALMVIASTYLVRLPSAYWAGVMMGWGIAGIWIAVCLELVLRASMIAIYFASGRWSHKPI